MIRATVTVRTPTGRHTFPAIGPSTGQIHADALEQFGGLCSVTVIPH